MAKETSKKPARIKKTDRSASMQHYEMSLYVTGMTPRSARAVENIRKMCEEHLKGRYTLEIVDVYRQPASARGERIVAAPTLVMKKPFPLRRFIGDMSGVDRILRGLDLPAGAAQRPPRCR